MNGFNVFFDNNNPPQLARMLAGFLSAPGPAPLVVHLRDVLPPNAMDEEWLGWIGQQPGQWIAVSQDTRMLKNVAERRAFERHVGRIVLTPKALLSRPHNERAALFVWHWRSITEIMERAAPPTVITIPGKLRAKVSIAPLPRR